MMHITYADKSLLAGDEAVKTLLEYAALLAGNGKADTVELHAFNSDGNDVRATFLLGSGTSVMGETATGKMTEPDNTEAIDYMRTQMTLILNRRRGLIEDAAKPGFYDDFDL